MDNQAFRTDQDEPVFRPGGHGALLDSEHQAREVSDAI
jgi:hypothetical protein